MRDLSITLVQTHTVWHEPAANRERFAERLAGLAEETDLVLLPEMFTTGFTMASAEQAETMDGPTIAWLLDQAARLDAAVCGSVVVEEGGRHYNRFLAALPDGGLVAYDKRHLFRMADEHAHYSAGTERRVFTFRGWRICPQVCYDLRFPVFSRNRLAGEDAVDAYDLLLYPANWPARRAHQWRTLLPARAVENLAYVAGVNVVGTDGAGIAYAGGSGLWSFTGEIAADLGDGDADARCLLSAGALADWRAAFPAWKDADDFVLAR